MCFIPEQADLVFRTLKLRKLASLPIVCDNETVKGKAEGLTCGACTRCFRWCLYPVAPATGYFLAQIEPVPEHG